MPLISVVVMAVPVISSELCSLSLGFHCQHVCQIMEILPAFPRQTKPRELPNAHHSPLRSFEPGKHWTFLWDGVSRAREQVRSCWYGNKFCSLLLVCFLIMCVLSVPVWDYSTGRVGGPLVCCEIKLKDWVEGEWDWERSYTHMHFSFFSFLRVISCRQTHTWTLFWVHQSIRR